MPYGMVNLSTVGINFVIGIDRWAETPEPKCIPLILGILCDCNSDIDPGADVLTFVKMKLPHVLFCIK